MRLGPTAEEEAFAAGLERALAGLGGAGGERTDDQRKDGQSEENWAVLARLGLTGLGIGERLGGSGGGLREVGIAARQLAAAGEEAGLGAGFAETVAGAVPVLLQLEGVGEVLRAVAAGRRRLAVVGREAGVAAVARGDGYALSGQAALVRGGSVADAFLVAARLVAAREEGGALLLFDVPRERVTLRPVTVVDGAPTADMVFEDVLLPAACCLARGARAEAALAAGAVEYLVVRLIAAAASIGALVALTREHVGTRRQFGRPLAGFQVIQHRVARLSVLGEEARAAALFAEAEAGAAPERQARALASAFVRLAEVGEEVAREAVQLHGAIGFTAECRVARHLTGLFAFRHMGQETGVAGGLKAQVARLAAFCRAPEAVARPLAGGPGAADPGAGLTLGLEAADAAFFAEAEAFAASALTPALRRGARLTVGVFASPEVAGPWHRLLYEKGWIAPYLPPAAGGTGWSPLRACLFEHAMAAAGAPALQLQGLRMLAPVLLRYGTPAQQARYLPRILSGEDLWCQGYSEPGAGSDLAALRTRAVAEGDFYVVNGSKIWTTQAQFASHMFALVRTATGGRRQEGISFLLIDMATPGITVRPIRTIAGEEEINEVFLDGVRVPKENLVGQENEGWACARYLLDFERGGSTVSGSLRACLARALRRVQEAWPGSTVDAARLASVVAALDAFEVQELAAVEAAMEGGGEGDGGDLHVLASARKLRMTEIRQQIGRLAADALGREALRWPAGRPLTDAPERSAAEEEVLATVPGHFDDFSYSIFAGSSEIQLGIIAAALGLRGER